MHTRGHEVIQTTFPFSYSLIDMIKDAPEGKGTGEMGVKSAIL